MGEIPEYFLMWDVTLPDFSGEGPDGKFSGRTPIPDPVEVRGLAVSLRVGGSWRPVIACRLVIAGT